MDKKDGVIEQLKELISVYGFNKNTLSRYLDLPVGRVERLAQGELDFLPDEPTYRFQIFNKIIALYESAAEDKDLELIAFLQVLISKHGLSSETIAKMADVEKSDVEKILSCPPKKVSEEVKYRIAVTVMALRFCLKSSL